MCDTIATGSSAGKGRVVQQLTYDAYGEALTSATLQPHPVLRCGHKGLFVDRLDVGVMSNSFIEFERIIPFSHLLVNNRNRVYSPQVGRFLQADPNEAGMSLMAASGYNGRGSAALSVAFGLEGHYGDGMNHYEYLGSNPWMRSDELGLSWDPFDLVDEFTASRAASASALLGQIGAAAHAVAMVAATIMAQLPFPLVSNLGDIAAAILSGEDIGEYVASQGLAVLLGCVPGANLLMSMGSIALDFYDFYTDYSQDYAEEFDDESGEEPANAARDPDYYRNRNGTATHEVYVGRLNGKGPIVYTGISKDLPQRGKDHGSLKIKPLGKGTGKGGGKLFPEYIARGMETAVMTKYPGAKSGSARAGTKINKQFKPRNKRLSIGNGRRFRTSALSDGLKYLRIHAPEILDELGMK